MRLPYPPAPEVIGSRKRLFSPLASRPQAVHSPVFVHPKGEIRATDNQLIRTAAEAPL